MCISDQCYYSILLLKLRCGTWFAFTEGVIKVMSLIYYYRLADPSTRSTVSEVRNGCLERGAWLTLDAETTAAAVWDAPDFPPFSGLKERLFVLLQQCKE